MPGDTKIKRLSTGWVDVDEPNKPYGARWQARNARRLRLQGRYAALAAIPVAGSTPPATTPTAPTPAIGLNSLQQRLFDRLTGRQGVTSDEALAVINSGGYNRAASYGHIRKAGATHAEALAVVELRLPNVSLSYGIARGAGESHDDALAEALGDAADA